MIEKKIEEETVAETKVEEKRIRPTVIRRRRQLPVSGPKVEVRSESEEVEADKAVEKLEATIVEDKVEVKEVEKVAKEIDKKNVAVLAVKKEAPKVKAKVKKQDKKSAIEPVAPKRAMQEKKKGKAPLDSVKEVIVFPNDKTDQKKTFHKKKVFSKEQLYFAKERRRGRVSKLPKRELKKTEITVTKASKRVVKVTDTISVVNLSQRLGVKASDIIKKLISLGIMATINQFIDLDAATLIANDFGFDVENVAAQEDVLVEGDLNEEPENLEPRPPVVTVMGHVDHGKTLLLDTIRKTNVIGGEHGGITQHIGAYHVHLEKGDITFIDTPGHEAFTSMRARGVKVTDIVILVVAADDGVMPQTIEAINHAKAAEVPIIVAINKVDLPNVDVDKVLTELTQYGLVPEEWGGGNIFVKVSAKSGLHVKDLLELVLLQSEVLELKANPLRLGRGVVLEAKLDKGRGVVATALVQDGSLKVGDVIVSGVYCGRIRAMLDAQGKRVEKAGPSIPVEILGLSGVPDAGDLFSIVKDEAIAKQIANIRLQKRQEKELGKTAKVTLDDLYSKIQEGEMKELGVVIKGDVHGSVEAVKDVLSKLSTEAIKLNIIHGAVGGITEGDVMLASASSAIIIGFNVRPEPKVNSLANKEGVDIRLYDIIYDVVEDVKKAMEGLLAPIIKETVLGRVEVRQLFKVSKVGTVAGSYVIDGKILRSAMVRLIREDAVIYQGKIASLKRLKENIKEVNAGFECGIAIEGYNDMKVGDIIEAYMIEEEAAKL